MERLSSSSEVPEFGTYPEESVAQGQSLEATYRTYRRYSLTGENRWIGPAERIGTRIGLAVAALRDRIERVQARRRENAQPAAQRLARLANEQPMRVLLGIAAAGVALGIGIRVWRDHA
jgi:hypothetical protein